MLGCCLLLSIALCYLYMYSYLQASRPSPYSIVGCLFYLQSGRHFHFQQHVPLVQYTISHIMLNTSQVENTQPFVNHNITPNRSIARGYFINAWCAHLVSGIFYLPKPTYLTESGRYYLNLCYCTLMWNLVLFLFHPSAAPLLKNEPNHASENCFSKMTCHLRLLHEH